MFKYVNYQPELSFTQTFLQAFTPAISSGVLKSRPEDFIVLEELLFPFSGDGEHAYLQIRKTNQNTQWVARCLAQHFSVKERDIGYAGMKDRFAVTTQWFSLPAKNISEQRLAEFNQDGIEIVAQQRHRGKLRKGAVKHNQFRLVLRDVDAQAEALSERIELIRRLGVPNYFDEQRFGRERQNLLEAEKMFNGKFKAKRQQQGIYLSAARSWLFNQVLAERVRQQVWDKALSGDVFLLAGTQSVFHAETIDEQIRQRLLEHDIHPTAPLWGRGELATSVDALKLEQKALQDWSVWCDKLEHAGLKQQRRATRVIADDLNYAYDDANKILTLEFKLPAGAYATNLVREIIEIKS